MTGGYAFAIVMLIIIGVFQAIAGLVAIIDDDFYVVGQNYTFNFDTSGWGWIHLLLGLLLILVGYFLYTGAVWAVVFASCSQAQRDRELLLHPVLPVLVDPPDRAGRLGDLGADPAGRRRPSLTLCRRAGPFVGPALPARERARQARRAAVALPREFLPR